MHHGWGRCGSYVRGTRHACNPQATHGARIWACVPRCSTAHACRRISSVGMPSAGGAAGAVLVPAPAPHPMPAQGRPSPSLDTRASPAPCRCKCGKRRAAPPAAVSAVRSSSPSPDAFGRARRPWHTPEALGQQLALQRACNPPTAAHAGPAVDAGGQPILDPETRRPVPLLILVACPPHDHPVSGSSYAS